MKITNIQQQSTKTHTTLSGDVTFANGKTESVYFRIENKYKTFAKFDATPFLAAFLLTAMRKKENLIVEGIVSQTLLTNIDKIMDLAEGWNVRMSKINVIASSAMQNEAIPSTRLPRRSAPRNDGKIACFFTGGVDSFYTFLKHKKTISHFILIHGCDIPLHNKEFFHDVFDSVSKVAKDAGVKVVVVETNMRLIIEPHLEWEWELGGALSSIGLFLSNGFERIYIPSGLRYDQLCPYGTHPLLDPLFSTENLEINHDGCEYSRLEKVTKTIANSPLALRYLRVCCQVMKGKYNCNECMKCLQTKMELLCAHALDKAQTLDNRINLKLVKKNIFNTKLNYHLYAQDILDSLKRQKREPELQKAVASSLKTSKELPLLRRIANFIAYVDKTYLERRIYSLIFGFTEEHDRNIIYKMLLKLRLIS